VRTPQSGGTASTVPGSGTSYRKSPGAVNAEAAGLATLAKPPSALRRQTRLARRSAAMESKRCRLSGKTLPPEALWLRGDSYRPVRHALVPEGWTLISRQACARAYQSPYKRGITTGLLVR
jgi:hypothetical protein